MICLRVNQAGAGARSTADLYHPFIWCQDYFWRGCSTARSVSISLPASSVLHRRYSFRIVLIARPRRRMRDWSCAGFQCADTLMSTRLHVASKIQLFFLDSFDLGFEIVLLKAANILSSLIGVVGGSRGIRVSRLRYSACYLRVALQRQPNTM